MGRERETETERERGRQAGRQAETESDKPTDRQREHLPIYQSISSLEMDQVFTLTDSTL